jgi:PAS domain S-box-containing protein
VTDRDDTSRLSEEQTLLRMLFDAMPQLGWTARADGWIDYYNRGWYEYTSTTLPEMEGWGWTKVHDPNELPRVMDSWKRAIATGKPWELEFPLRRHDGVYRWFLSRATPIYDAGGTLVRWVGINTDIDDQKRAQRQLAELDRAKTIFFSNVSHELRTPLTLILGPIEDALRAPGRTLAGAELERVQRNAARLLKLVNTLLTYAAMEAGRANASFVPTDIAALTRDVASAFRSAVEAAGVQFEIDCPTIDAAIFVDRDSWEKVVLNLASNAIKFTFEGSIAVRVRMQGDQVVLEVTDTGTGIPAEELPHVFERFRRVSGARARTHEGSGIGLALVSEIVRMHGGSVDVRSEVGRGSTFAVRIPVGNAHLPLDSVGAAPLDAIARFARPYVDEALQWIRGADASTPASDRGAASAAEIAIPDAIRGARVVLADDNADMRDYLQRLLAASFDVEAAADGDDALVAARRRRPDLVLTDVMMPVLDGFGLLRALRTDPSLQRVPVIMLSARAGEESRVEGLRAGADDYLVKPFSARELIARVVTHLQLAKLREAVERERRLLELFVEHAPADLAMFDRQMRYLAASRRWYTTFRTPDDLIGRCHYDLFPELPAAWRESHRRTLAGETLSSSEDRFDRADGAVLWVSWETRPWYERDGTIGGIMIASEDVTTSVLTRHALEDARREAERANRAKDEFMAMLGHELRNPLAPILTAVQLMRLRGPEGNASKLDVVERQVKHMLRLVDDLLDVSRIARGKVALSREPVELASVVAKAIEMAEPLVDANRHHLTVEVPRSGLEVDVDPARMAQVVSNLLTNAAKYTPSQGRIVVHARRESDDVVLEVQDNGIGIAPQLLPRVFDLFTQGRQGVERAQGGLGLGLAIVQSLVKLHGGSVSAASAGPDRGSTFTIRLPALRARGEVAIAGSRPADQGPRRAHDGSMRVLVVDDNQDAAQLTAEAVSAAGYQSDLAYDGLEALEHAQRSHPDIVLLDIGLPVLDGYEVARRLREMTGVSCPNIVAITGYGQEMDFRRTKEAGFDAHIVKPVNLDHLLAVLEEQCQRRRTDRTRET